MIAEHTDDRWLGLLGKIIEQILECLIGNMCCREVFFCLGIIRALHIYRCFPVRIRQITAVILNRHIEQIKRLITLVLVKLNDFLVAFLIADITDILRLLKVIDRDKIIKLHTLIGGNTVPVCTTARVDCFAAVALLLQIRWQ